MTASTMASGQLSNLISRKCGDRGAAAEAVVIDPVQPSEGQWPCARRRTADSSLVQLLDMPGFREELLLELGDIVEGGLGVLLAGDGEVILLLTLHQELEE